MRKSRISLALAAVFALGLAACGDPNDQRGDPMDPTQQAPATERDARQQGDRDSDRNDERSAERRDNGQERGAGERLDERGERGAGERLDDEAREREARQRAARSEGNINENLARDGYDPATNANTQPVAAEQDFHRPDLLARDFNELGDLEDEENVRTQQQAREELLTEIQRTLETRDADDVNQCAFVPMGHKACGGPERYVVYSQRDMSQSDIESFEEQIHRYNKLDAFIKTSENRMSTCDITPRPQISLEGGRCVAQDSRLSQPQEIE